MVSCHGYGWLCTHVCHTDADAQQAGHLDQPLLWHGAGAHIYVPFPLLCTPHILIWCMPLFVWMQSSLRKRLLVCRRSLLSFRGGAVPWTPEIASEAAVLNVEMFMRTPPLERITWNFPYHF